MNPEELNSALDADGLMKVFEKEMQEAALKKSQAHFSKTGVDPVSEEELLRCLTPDADKNTIEAALPRLGFSNSEAVIERMKALAVHPDPHIRAVSFRRAASALKEKGASFYVECLVHPRFREKSEAVFQIRRYGDASAVPAMTKRLAQIIRTRKGAVYCFHNGETELTWCVDFLQPYIDQPAVQKAFDSLIAKWSMVDRREVGWLTDQVAYFRKPPLHSPSHPIPCIAHVVDSDHPVLEAARKGDIQTVKSHLANGVSVYSDDQSRSLAGIALQRADLGMLQLLVEKGLDIERPVHGFDKFPILEAIRNKQDAIADYILDLKIDPNRRDEYDRSVFMIACCGLASTTQLQKMLRLGAKVNDRCPSGDTPFSHAATSEALETMELLLACGANINSADGNGWTSLIRCAQGGKVKAVEWLINHGADLIHCDEFGHDALYWAKRNNRGDVVQLLQMHLDRPPIEQPPSSPPKNPWWKIW